MIAFCHPTPRQNPIQILKTVKELLEQGRIVDATRLVEKSNHPKLWNILAESALRRLDFKTASHCFVMLKDYGGLQFLKRVQSVQSEALRRAEVFIFLGDLDAAEKIYAEEDRRDLTLAMWRKMYDW